MIRLLLVALFLITFLILSIPIFFIEWLIGKKNPALRDISSLRIVQWAFKVILWLSGCRLTVIGECPQGRSRALHRQPQRLF